MAKRIFKKKRHLDSTCRFYLGRYSDTMYLCFERSIVPLETHLWRYIYYINFKIKGKSGCLLFILISTPHILQERYRNILSVGTVRFKLIVQTQIGLLVSTSLSSVGCKIRRCMTKPTKWHMHPTKTHISLGVHPVWSVFAVCMRKPCVLSYP